MMMKNRNCQLNTSNYYLLVVVAYLILMSIQRAVITPFIRYCSARI